MPVPVVLLGRLAVDKRYHSKGPGKQLLPHALWRAQQVSTQMGVYAVDVDALSDQARSFYLKYGFIAPLDNPRHLYLAIKTIEALGLDFQAE